ncbi:MAG: Transposase family [Segetibacter sp.]|nr:Transposase family [Segetibacter sp.]
MANTYTQLFVQIVFAVKGRHNLIPKIHSETLNKYITTVIQKDKHKMLAVYCMPDHIHFLAGLNPDISISNMVLDVKRSSTNFINQNNFISNHFNWQKGYGAFSYSKSQVPKVINYILNQESHHKRKTFREEYLLFLKKFEIEYDEKYLFEFYDR